MRIRADTPPRACMPPAHAAAEDANHTHAAHEENPGHYMRARAAAAHVSGRGAAGVGRRPRLADGAQQRRGDLVLEGVAAPWTCPASCRSRACHRAQHMHVTHQLNPLSYDIMKGMHSSGCMRTSAIACRLRLRCPPAMSLGYMQLQRPSVVLEKRQACPVIDGTCEVDGSRKDK